jgi:hypothetical protein
MSDDGKQAAAEHESEQADRSIDQSPFSKPKMEEIGKPLLPWWGRKKRAGKR